MGSSPRNCIQSILIVLIIIINKCNCYTVFTENAGILLPEGECTVACMKRIRIDLIVCRDNCKQSNRSVQLEQVKSDGTIRLLCRDFDLLTELRSYLLKSNEENGIWNGRTKELYVVKARQTNNKSSQQFASIIGIPRNYAEKPMNNSNYLVTDSYNLVKNRDATILLLNLTAPSGTDLKYCDQYTMEIFGRLENKQYQTQTEIVEKFYPRFQFDKTTMRILIIMQFPLIAVIFVFALTIVLDAMNYPRNAHRVEIELKDLQFHV